MFQIFVGFEHGREWWLELCLAKKKKEEESDNFILLTNQRFFCH
jgi:hypothetical protein